MSRLIRSRMIVGVLLLGVIGALVPYRTTVVPRWKLQVVDENGKPYSGITVTQAWKDYTLETEAGQNFDLRNTDKDGYVEFPEKTIRAGLAKRIFLTAYSAAMVLAHGSFGIKAYVHASGPDGYSEVRYVPGKPPPDKLVLPSQMNLGTAH